MKLDNDITEKLNMDSHSSLRNKGNPLVAESNDNLNNQQSSCKTEKQDGIDAITLLKPLLIEVLDEIKNSKINNDADHINSKMQSLQRDIDEKIELIKPTLLEVLNELKESKKLIKQEVPFKSAPVEIIKPMLVGVLEEIKESNRKTQQAINEIKKSKKQALRERIQTSVEDKMNEDKLIESFPVTVMYSKNNEISDQTEYDSTKEENVNSIASDESYITQTESLTPCQGPLKTRKEKHHVEVVKKKHRKMKRNAPYKVDNHYSSKRKRKSHHQDNHKHAHKRNARSFRKNDKYSDSISPSNIFNASEILSSPIKKEMVKDVIKVMTKKKLVSMVSELLADRFIDKLKLERSRNDTRRIYHPDGTLIKVEETKDLFNAVKVDSTTDKPVTIQRFEIFLG